MLNFDYNNVVNICLVHRGLSVRENSVQFKRGGEVASFLTSLLFHSVAQPPSHLYAPFNVNCPAEGIETRQLVGKIAPKRCSTILNNTLEKICFWPWKCKQIKDMYEYSL